MITVLAGGTGSVKLIRGIVRTCRDEVVIVSNVGDNMGLYGLTICPDIDTIMYGLVGILDRERGWGIEGDSFNFLRQSEAYGYESWFGIGDRDLATHILRTQMLKAGRSLAEVTEILSKKLGLEIKIIPASNDSIQTYILTPNGEMHLQEFWVKRRGEDEVVEVEYRGARDACPAEDVVESLMKSRGVIIPPANPITSIGPILSISEIKRALTECSGHIVAVSPMVGDAPVSGPAGRLMKSLGVDASALGVVKLYQPFLDGIILDSRDQIVGQRISDLGVKVWFTDIVMRSEVDEDRVASFTLECLKELG